jgi:hypothetical protein
MAKKYLVVWEDIWHNKDSYFTDKIGDTIKKIVDDYELVYEHDCDVDYEKYNSDNPYDVGTMSLGFYDLGFNDTEGEYAGRVMIFDLQEQDN